MYTGQNTQHTYMPQECEPHSTQFDTAGLQAKYQHIQKVSKIKQLENYAVGAFPLSK
jgi:hypothetical protein